MAKKRTTTDAIEIIDNRYFKGKPERLAELEEARDEAQIARTIYELRTKARLTQRELAELVGTSTSVIPDLKTPVTKGGL